MDLGFCLYQNNFFVIFFQTYIICLKITMKNYFYYNELKICKKIIFTNYLNIYLLS